jgi:hypothetical protein
MLARRLGVNHDRHRLDKLSKVSVNCQARSVEESVMRDQMLVFMQSAVIFLLLTNAASALVALYAMKTANMLTRPGLANNGQAKNAVERKLEALLGR